MLNLRQVNEIESLPLAISGDVNENTYLTGFNQGIFGFYPTYLRSIREYFLSFVVASYSLQIKLHYIHQV